MGKDGNWASTFEMVCAKIIDNIHIVSIANMKGRFMTSDTLQSIDAYQISNDIILNSENNLYCIAI